MIVEIKKPNEVFLPFDKNMIYLRVLNAQDKVSGEQNAKKILINQKSTCKELT